MSFDELWELRTALIQQKWIHLLFHNHNVFHETQKKHCFSSTLLTKSFCLIQSGTEITFNLLKFTFHKSTIKYMNN